MKSSSMVPGLIGQGLIGQGLISMAIGQKLRRFLNEAQFRILFFLGLIIAGGSMLARAWLM